MNTRFGGPSDERVADCGEDYDPCGKCDRCKEYEAFAATLPPAPCNKPVHPWIAVMATYGVG